MHSKGLFSIGYILLFASTALLLLIFVVNPISIFSLPENVAPNIELLFLDSIPTLVFFVGVGFLAAGQVKQWKERNDEL